MELYGSLLNISGSVTASTFTGSFIGDGSGLTGIQASGVTGLNLSQIGTGSVSASLTPSGFNVNTNTSITGSLNVSGTVVSQTTTLISSSIQVDITGTTGYSTFSSSIATTDLNQENRLTALETSSGSLNSFTSSINTTIKDKLNTENVISSSAQVTTYGFATTGSNTFIGTQTLSGSIIPAIDNAYDLGSPTYQWRDVYISSGSLYIDGTKVLSSTAQELTITTDNGQSIKILEGTTDSIILQTADGDIELKSSADGDILLDPTNGKIMLKGPVEILTGQKIQSSVGGTPVIFANDIVVSGSIDLTGTIDGIDLQSLSSSLNTRIGGIETTTGSLNSYTSSNTTNIIAIHTATSSLNTFTSSANERLSSLESASGSIRSDFNSFTSSNNSVESTQNGRLSSLENVTGSYATTGSNTFQGSQTITGSLFISENLIVAGSSSIQHISSSVVNIADNIITVNALNPSIRFGGLAVIDSGSSPTVSGSMLFDSVNDQWLFVHQNQGTITSSVLLMGPETYNNLGNEGYLTLNRIPKGSGIEHLRDSNISDNGTTVTILSNTVINGTLSATGTTLVSGSSQVIYGNLTGIPSGIVSGSSQVLNGTTIHSGSFFNNISVVSGSGQISFNGITDKPSLVSGSSQISFNSISDRPTLVSGSSQIDLTATTNYSSGIKTRLNAEGVLSGSAQVVASLPNNTVSGSAQVILSGTTGFGTYLNQSVLTTSLPTFAGITSTAQISAGYSNTSEPFANGHFYNTSGTAGTQYGGVLLSGVQQAHVRFLVGTNTWGGSGAKQWQIRVGNGVGEDNMKIYSWTYGNDVLTISSNAAAVFAGNLSAANLSGTNTGDQTNITGNAGTVTNGVYTSGDQTIGGTKTFSATIVGSVNGNSSTVGGITPIQFFNNMGDNHGTRTSFDASTPSYNFGFRYVQGSTNGPGTGAGQFYSWYIGLGNDYPATGAGSYGAMFAVDRNVTTPYLSVRYNENNSFGSWRKIHAGYADTAGNITAYTINQNLGTSNSVKFGSHCDLNITGSAFRFYDGSTFRGGLGLDDWAHSGSAANITLFASGVLHFTSGGTKRAYFDTSGHLLPQVNNTYNLGSSSLGWANVYTNDLHLSNMNKPEGNDVDGTNGNWTIQEGAENLYIINNNNGKKFKIKLEEI